MHGTYRAALAGLAAAVAASGCGSQAAGRSAVTPELWHGSVCRAVAEWSSDVHDPYFTLKGVKLRFQYGAPTRTSTRDKEIDATAALESATRRLRESLDDAGTPSIDHGAAAEAELVAAARELESAFAQIHERAEALPAGDGRPLRSALLDDDVDAAMTRMVNRVRASRRRYHLADMGGCPRS